MSSSIDQKAYLQKYLGEPSGDKKKKKKKSNKGKGFKIIDDDLDLSKLRPLDSDELDILDQGEDAPQIAGIIDERPAEVKRLEQFMTSSKWRVVNQDDGFNSKLQIKEIKENLKQKEKENELIFGKMYSDSEDDMLKDPSPPRKQSIGQSTSRDDSTNKHFNINSEFSASTQRRTEYTHRLTTEGDSDQSPPRKSRQRVRKPTRWADADSTDTKTLMSPDTDQSPNKLKDFTEVIQELHKRRSSRSVTPLPRRSHKSRRDKTHRSKKRSKKHSKRSRSVDSDMSPQRKRKHSSEKHASRKDDKKRCPRSLARKAKKQLMQKNNKRKYNSDSNPSPPRKDGDRLIPDRNKSKCNSDSDPSPSRNDRDILIPRRNKSKRNSDSDPSPSRKDRDRLIPDRNKSTHTSDSDPSPLRKDRYRLISYRNKSKDNSDSDPSPPKRTKHRRNHNKNNRSRKRSNDSLPPSIRKMAKTLEGKKAGLQDARQLRQENEEFRRKEEDIFNKMEDEVSGRNAKAVSRKCKRETSEERKKQKEKAQRQKELDEKYKKWSKGLKQQETQDARVRDFMHEATKPLARHKDDRDLEAQLKQTEREGDPMLKYIRDKKRQRGELGPEKPLYKGSFPPNRFNIRPGYRWDGVDRSNGYEKKFFEQQSKKKAQAEEAYKWSIEDL